MSRWREPFQAGMTVDELIAELSDLSEEQRALPVVFVCNYGDYHRTQQALPVSRLAMSPEPIHESAYSHSGWAVTDRDERDDDEDEDEDEDEENPAPTVIVLR